MESYKRGTRYARVGTPECVRVPPGSRRECGVMVHIEGGRSSVVCWCERCRDLRAYEVDNGRASSPAA